MDRRVQIEVEKHVATVTMMRAQKHNALDLAMFDALNAAIEQLASEPGVRAVILRGDGPSFCSGIDLGSLAAQGVSGLLEGLGGPVPNRFQSVAFGWTTLAVPVIAAIHGNCLGGGLQIALGADIRIAAPDARLSVMEVKWGLIPDMGISHTLPRLVRIDVARELTYSGRTIDGVEAEALGIVTRVVEDPLSSAQTLAREIATKSPTAIRGAKRLFDSAWTAAAPDALALEAEIQQSLMGSPNQTAAVAAGLTHEAPKFID